MLPFLFLLDSLPVKLPNCIGEQIARMAQTQPLDKKNPNLKSFYLHVITLDRFGELGVVQHVKDQPCLNQFFLYSFLCGHPICLKQLVIPAKWIKDIDKNMLVCATFAPSKPWIAFLFSHEILVLNHQTNKLVQQIDIPYFSDVDRQKISIGLTHTHLWFYFNGAQGAELLDGIEWSLDDWDETDFQPNEQWYTNPTFICASQYQVTDDVRRQTTREPFLYRASMSNRTFRVLTRHSCWNFDLHKLIVEHSNTLLSYNNEYPKDENPFFIIRSDLNKMWVMYRLIGSLFMVCFDLTKKNPTILSLDKLIEEPVPHQSLWRVNKAGTVLKGSVNNKTICIFRLT